MDPLYVLLFYGFHFNDYWSTVLGLKIGVMEGNPLVSSLRGNVVLLAIYKFAIATLILYLATSLCQKLPTVADLILYVDSVVEALATINNIYVMWSLKVKRI